MGHTHTKLLAGAFSALAVLQFFMVADLARQVNQFTDNATASVVSLRQFSRFPTRPTGEKGIDRLQVRLRDQMMHSAATSAASSTEVSSDRPTAGMVRVMTNKGPMRIVPTRPMKAAGEHVETTDAVETSVTAQ